jgi:hypothetical protein
MKRYKSIFKFMLWFLFFVTFTGELVKIVFESSPAIGHKSLGLANAFFWSSLFLMEMVMAGLVIYFMINFPARRIRLAVLSLCHFSIVLALPVMLNNWSWTCLLYPWPHTFQAFDPATPNAAFLISAIAGFILVPIITFTWGVKGFCGYICPHGAFYSETYGRVFSSRYPKINPIGRFVPPLYFALMTGALVAVLLKPELIVPVRSVQKTAFFLTAELFFFVIGIPLLGGRSYCSLICPMGYFVRLLVRAKLKMRSGQP